MGPRWVLRAKNKARCRRLTIRSAVDTPASYEWEAHPLPHYAGIKGRSRSQGTCPLPGSANRPVVSATQPLIEDEMRSDPAPLPFLTGGGELAQLIGSMDWGRTELGPIDQWPAHTKTATSLMLRSVVPMVMLWGRDGVMVYNNAYAVFAGDRPAPAWLQRARRLGRGLPSGPGRPTSPEHSIVGGDILLTQQSEI